MQMSFCCSLKLAHTIHLCASILTIQQNGCIFYLGFPSCFGTVGLQSSVKQSVIFRSTPSIKKSSTVSCQQLSHWKQLNYFFQEDPSKETFEHESEDLHQKQFQNNTATQNGGKFWELGRSMIILARKLF